MTQRPMGNTEHGRSLQHVSNDSGCPTQRITSWLAQLQGLDQSKVRTITSIPHDSAYRNKRCRVVSVIGADDDAITLSSGPGTTEFSGSDSIEAREKEARQLYFLRCLGPKPVPFEKPPRHKTRADRYDVDKRKESNAPKRRKRFPSRIRDRSRKVVPGAHVMDHFSSEVLARNKITVKPKLTTGMFLNGRSSKLNQLTDLTFNTMPFLERTIDTGDQLTSSSLSTMHLRPTEQLFGCLHEAQDHEQEKGKEKEHHNKYEQDNDDGRPDILDPPIGDMGVQSKDEIEGFDLRPEVHHNEHPQMAGSRQKENPSDECQQDYGTHQADEALLRMEATSPSAATEKLSFTISPGSEGIDELIVSDVFDFHSRASKDPAELRIIDRMERSSNAAVPYSSRGLQTMGSSRTHRNVEIPRTATQMGIAHCGSRTPDVSNYDVQEAGRGIRIDLASLDGPGPCLGPLKPLDLCPELEIGSAPYVPSLGTSLKQREDGPHAAISSFSCYREPSKLSETTRILRAYSQSDENQLNHRDQTEWDLTWLPQALTAEIVGPHLQGTAPPNTEEPRVANDTIEALEWVVAYEEAVDKLRESYAVHEQLHGQTMGPRQQSSKLGEARTTSQWGQSHDPTQPFAGAFSEAHVHWQQPAENSAEEFRTGRFWRPFRRF